MSKVADFTAFLSVTADGESVFETQDGRVVITRDEIAVGGEGETRRLPLETLAEFDFRTVPEGWEQFFDNLVGIRFDTPDGETTVTIGTKTEVADRFVTVLLKLIIEEMPVTVRQRLSPLDAEETHQTSGESTITLLPNSERIRFDDDVEPIDISMLTGFSTEESGTVVVHHLGEGGRLTTEVTLENARSSQFLQTYLEFRGELAEHSGPVRFIYVGEDRDTLVLVAKLLNHRNLAFEAGHAHSSEELFEALDSTEMPTQCLVTEYELPDTRGEEFREQLLESEYDVPLVVLGRDSYEEPSFDGEDGVEVVHIGSRTEHYEDVADAIERAVYGFRAR